MYIFLFFMYNSYVQKIKGVYKMKSIKSFKYKNTNSFERFLCEHGYHLSDVSGYSIGWKEQYDGNTLKVYIIYFNTGKYERFSILFLKNIDEYKQISSGVKINKTIMWYDNANIAKYKYNDRNIIAKG